MADIRIMAPFVKGETVQVDGEHLIVYEVRRDAKRGMQITLLTPGEYVRSA